MHGRVQREPEDNRSQKLVLYQKLLYASLVFVLFLSLLSLPLKVSLIRDIWFDKLTPRSYHLTQLPNDQLYAQVDDSNPPADHESPTDPSATPWIYTTVAALEVVHTLVLFLAFSAVYDVSPRRTLISALIFITAACALLLAMLWICCYVVITGYVAIYIALGVFFSCFASFLLYDEIPIDFVVKSANGKSTPLLT